MECCVVGVEVGNDVYWYVCVIKESVYVCVRQACVGPGVCCGNEDRSLGGVKFYSEEVRREPSCPEFMSCVCFDEDGDPVVWKACRCCVCGVTIVFYGACGR